MIKIFLTVRNRLGITKKCIEAIQKHTSIPYQLYIYDNQTNYRVDEHFSYYCKLYKKGIATQITFNTDESTFNAFSKASACNFFGKQHQQDPNKNKTIFMVMLDNDIILTPGWDRYVMDAWKHVITKNINDVKIIGQTPGGIKYRKQTIQISDNFTGRLGKLGGSGLWTIRNNFFDDVGFLDLKMLVGHNKKHDQLYWRLLDRSTNGRPYILGLNKKLGIHCGKMAGSVCNRLTKNQRNNKNQKLNSIKFEAADDRIEQISFDEFYKKISNDKLLHSDW